MLGFGGSSALGGRILPVKPQLTAGQHGEDLRENGISPGHQPVAFYGAHLLFDKKPATVWPHGQEPTT
jgi:hypothetical protein